MSMREDRVGLQDMRWNTVQTDLPPLVAALQNISEL